MDVFVRNITHKIPNNRENGTFHDACLSPFESQMTRSIRKCFRIYGLLIERTNVLYGETVCVLNTRNKFLEI